MTRFVLNEIRRGLAVATEAGLGVGWCREVVDCHGGTIWCVCGADSPAVFLWNVECDVVVLVQREQNFRVQSGAVDVLGWFHGKQSESLK